ncbi:unnamed protein product, partial [marine sediment metagenome]
WGAPKGTGEAFLIIRTDVRRSVEVEQAEEFKQKFKLDHFFETSSKNGKNNEDIFETLTRLILKRQKTKKQI